MTSCGHGYVNYGDADDAVDDDADVDGGESRLAATSREHEIPPLHALGASRFA